MSLEKLKRARSRAIYLDNHATTPVDPRIAAVMLDVMQNSFGNASSVDHVFGIEASHLVEHARGQLSTFIGVDPESVRFTSGSTDAIRLTFEHAIQSNHHRQPLRVALSTVEHRAVLDTALAAERAGTISITWIPVDEHARLDLEALERVLADGTDLVCIMAANNEVGTIYPIEVVSQKVREAGSRLMVDATQAAAYIPLQHTAQEIDYLVLSAHKMYGPKGVGALVISPYVLAQNKDFQEGTANVPGIVGFGEACHWRKLEMHIDVPAMSKRRNRLQQMLTSLIPNVTVNGDQANRLPHNLHLSVAGVPNDAVTARLHEQVAISTGAACTSGAQERSHVLRAMGLTNELQEGALRIGLSRWTSDEEVVRSAELISAAVESTRLALVTA